MTLPEACSLPGEGTLCPFSLVYASLKNTSKSTILTLTNFLITSNPHVDSLGLKPHIQLPSGPWKLDIFLSISNSVSLKVISFICQLPTSILVRVMGNCI